MVENKYTPSTIGNIRFSIPLYQRLFEWEEMQITQLLNDLYSSFKKSKDNPQPYYIGMLTIYKENEIYSLVDGQQRFTVLMLMAIAFETDYWKQFLKTNNMIRLSFFARKKDESYLNDKFKNIENPTYINYKMENGLKIIRKFITNLVDNKLEFIEYVYKYSTFFLSELPDNYKTQDLNRYFESMNANGRGLENHEILKVNLLKKLQKDKEFYTKVWNSVSLMDKCLIRQRTWGDKKEDVKTFQARIITSLLNLDKPFDLYNCCNDLNKNVEISEFYSIKEIDENPKPPNKQITTRDERAILNFSEFLLQVLWLQLSADERKTTNDFFNIQKLQTNFQNHLPDEKVELFFQNLLKYRILFDYFILRISNTDQYDVGYFLNYSEENSDNEEYRKLLQYQAMLNVSSSSYLWLTETFEYIVNNPTTINATEFLYKLKEIDNARQCNRKDITLEYGKIDRYWFWRLDYYLWERRNEEIKGKKIFNSDSIQIVENYMFKTNRSIEHIEPQTLMRENKRLLSEEKLDLFGNLVMISSGQNSSLQNQSFEVKHAYVKSFINERKIVSIESLKMLKIYEFQIWDDKNFEIHSVEMGRILIDSIPEIYKELRDNFKKQFIKNEN